MPLADEMGLGEGLVKGVHVRVQCYKLILVSMVRCCSNFLMHAMLTH